MLVATASLELGIDIGDVDLVCQLGSPRAIAAFLQRVGRSGHHVGGVPKGRLFPSSRDDLAECAALLDCVRRGELDALAHAAGAAGRAGAADRRRSRRAASGKRTRCTTGSAAPGPTRNCRARTSTRSCRCWPKASPRAAARAPATCIATPCTSACAAARGGRMTAVMSGGTIPDTGDYAVMLEPQAQNIGTVNEDFAIESLAGDIFQLGNASYRILRVEPGRVRVEDAQGVPPSIPFWLGEAPGRSDELSHRRLAPARGGPARDRVGSEAAQVADARWLDATSVGAATKRRRRAQLADYLGAPAGRARRACRRSRRWRWNASSTNPAAPSWSSIRPTAAASTAPGAWRCASASAASSTSNCRRRRPRTRSCCRCRPATASR